jgi:uncharacterized protein (DUF983 family)
MKTKKGYLTGYAWLDIVLWIIFFMIVSYFIIKLVKGI